MRKNGASLLLHAMAEVGMTSFCSNRRVSSCREKIPGKDGYGNERPFEQIFIAVCNDYPNRISEYPQTWLIHVDGLASVPVHVERDGKGKTNVSNSDAA